MALATTDEILTDAIDAITIAVAMVIAHRIVTVTVAVHPIADVVHRHQDTTITVATTF